MARLGNFAILATVLTPDPPPISLHLYLLYAVPPDLQQNMFLGIYQRYGVSFPDFHHCVLCWFQGRLISGVLISFF